MHCRPKAAGYIAQRVPKGKVIVIGGPPVPSITNYTNCFVKAAKTVGLNVVGKQDNVKDTAATAQPIVPGPADEEPRRQRDLGLQRPERARRRGRGSLVREEGLDRGQAEGHRDHRRERLERRGRCDQERPDDGDLGSAAEHDGHDRRPAALAVHLKQGKPISAMPKLIVIPIKLWDAKNIGTYVDPLKRKLKMAPIPAAWIKKK